jgi:hypothetical protein
MILLLAGEACAAKPGLALGTASPATIPPLILNSSRLLIGISSPLAKYRIYY